MPHEHPPAALTSVQSLFWNSPGLTAFMAATGIPRSAPIAVVDDPNFSVLPPQDGNGATYWLPVAPYAELNILPMANRLAHLQRYVERHHLSGWLIVQRVRSRNDTWLPQALLRWYEPGQTVSNADWTATYFRYRG